MKFKLSDKTKAFLIGGAVGLITHVLNKSSEVKSVVKRKRRSMTFKRSVYAHQNGLCNACRKKIPISIMEMDHVTPIASGGTDHDSNLQLLCRPCNRRKGKKPIHNFNI